MTGISAHRNNLTPVLGQVFLSVGMHTPTGCRDLMKCQPRIMQVSSFYYSRNILFFYATFICIRWEGRGQQRGSQPGRQNEFDGEGGQEEDEQDGFWRWSSLERGAVCRCCHLFTPSPPPASPLWLPLILLPFILAFMKSSWPFLCLSHAPHLPSLLSLPTLHF